MFDHLLESSHRNDSNIWLSIGFGDEITQVESIEVAYDKVCMSFSRMSISSPIPMFDHLLKSSYRDDSNIWSSIGFGEEITQVEVIEVDFTHPIWCSECHT